MDYADLSPARRSDGFEIRRQKNDLTSLGSADLQSTASKIANPAEHLTRVLLQAFALYISNRLPVATEYDTLHILQISVIVAPLPLNE